MIIQTSDRTIDHNGLSDQGSFTIKASAAAFQMLSSGLYTNKIKAVLREIGCNAVDAHKLNKNEKTPIEVKLPNSLDKQFYIKDFGPGLSHEQIMKLYTTYFESSKQDSDDFIGGFGVGSKSPFAYTDSFTVESRHNGVKRIYTSFIGSTGMPSIAKLHEEPTGEANGLTVGFPVKENDVAAFAKESVNVFTWFEPRPVILGASLDWGDAQSMVKMRKVYTFQNGHIPGIGYTSPALRMGSVAYPLDNFWQQYEQTMGKPCHPSVEALKEFGVAFEVPIGTSSVAASREALQFDKLSLQRIHDTLKPIAAQFADDIYAKMSSGKGFFERVDNTKKWFDKMRWSYDSVRKLLKDTVTVSGVDDFLESVESSNIKLDPLDYPAIKFAKLTSSFAQNVESIKKRPSFKGLGTYAGLQSIKRKLIAQLGEESTYPAWDVYDELFKWNMRIIGAPVWNNVLPEGDVKTKDAWPFVYTTQFLEESNRHSYNHNDIWITRSKDASLTDFTKQLQALQETLGVTTASIIAPKEPEKVASVKREKALLLYGLNSVSSNDAKRIARKSMQSSGQAVPVPEDGPIICVTYNKRAQHLYDPEHLVEKIRSMEFMRNTIWPALAELIDIPSSSKVFFVPEEDWAAVKEVNEEAILWADLFNEIKDSKDVYQTIFDATDFPPCESVRYPMSSWLSSWREMTKNDLLSTVNSSFFNETMKQWDQESNASDAYNKAMTIRTIANQRFGFTMPIPKAIDRMAVFTQLKTTYPLLEHVIDNNSSLKHVVEYIELKEEARRKKIVIADIGDIITESSDGTNFTM